MGRHVVIRSFLLIAILKAELPGGQSAAQTLLIPYGSCNLFEALVYCESGCCSDCRIDDADKARYRAELSPALARAGGGLP